MAFVVLDFPREVLVLNSSGSRGFRKMMPNRASLERHWEGRNGIGDVYMTVYGYRATRPPKHHRCDYNTAIIRHFVLDFDCKNFRTHKEVSLDTAFEQTLILHQFLLKEDIRHAVWFSGGGFHVWVALAKTQMPSSGSENSAIKNAGRKVIQEWVTELGLSCSDPAVPFDTSGMIRIPNSYNARRGLWSIPLTTEEMHSLTAEEIQEKALDSHSGSHVYGADGVVLDVKKQGTPFKMNTPKMNIPTAQMDGVIILPCLNAAACQHGSNPEHLPRVYLAQYLLHRLRHFFPRSAQTEEEREIAVKQVLQFMGSLEWADWDEDRTFGYLRQIANTYDDHPTCATLYAQGLCIGKCSFHDGTGMIPDAREVTPEAANSSVVRTADFSNSEGDSAGSDTDSTASAGNSLQLVEREAVT